MVPVAEADAEVSAFAYLSPLLCISGLKRCDLQQLPSVRVCGEAGVLTLSDRLALERLRLVGRIAGSSKTVWVACATSGMASWMRMVLGDMALLREVMHDKLADLPCPKSNLQVWLKIMCEYPSAWKGILKSFRARRVQATVNKALRCVIGPPRPIAMFTIPCELCGLLCVSRRALATHLSMAHGKRRLVNDYLFDRDGTRCPICAVDFRSVVRLSNHLTTGSIGCVLAVHLGVLPIATEEQKEARVANERATRKLARLRGVCETAGPPAVRHTPPRQVFCDAFGRGVQHL